MYLVPSGDIKVGQSVQQNVEARVENLHNYFTFSCHLLGFLCTWWWVEYTFPCLVFTNTMCLNPESLSKLLETRIFLEGRLCWISEIQKERLVVYLRSAFVCYDFIARKARSSPLFSVYNWQLMILMMRRCSRLGFVLLLCYSWLASTSADNCVTAVQYLWTKPDRSVLQTTNQFYLYFYR